MKMQSPEHIYSLRQLLSGDLANALEHNSDVLGETRPSLRRKLNVCLTPGMLICLTHRIAHWLWIRGWSRLARCFSQFNVVLHHIDIHPACQIAPGLYIPHPAGILLQGHAGKKLVVLAGAGLSNSCNVAPEYWPRLGHDVWIASRALVSGPITVGDHVRIGPGAVLNESVQASTKLFAPRPVLAKR